MKAVYLVSIGEINSDFVLWQMFEYTQSPGVDPFSKCMTESREAKTISSSFSTMTTRKTTPISVGCKEQFHISTANKLAASNSLAQLRILFSERKQNKNGYFWFINS